MIIPGGIPLLLVIFMGFSAPALIPPEESLFVPVGGGSPVSHKVAERQDLPPGLLHTLGKWWVASLAPWVSLWIKQLKPLPGSACYG